MQSPHSVYLGIIAVLVVVIVFAIAKAVKARRAVRAAQRGYGITNIRTVTARRKGALRQDADAPARAHPLTYFQAQMNAIVARGTDPKSPDYHPAFLHVKSGERLESSLLLDVARAANQSRLTADDADEQSSPIDIAEAALAMEFVVGIVRTGENSPDLPAATIMMAAATQGICRQVDEIWRTHPEMPGADRLGMYLCGHIARTARNMAQIQAIRTDDIPPAAAMDALAARAPPFELAALIGWAAAGGSIAAVPKVRLAGKYLAIAFQVCADIRASEAAPDDVTPWNIVRAFGKKAAADTLSQNIAACNLALDKCKIRSPVWASLLEVATLPPPNLVEKAEEEPAKAAEIKAESITP